MHPITLLFLALLCLFLYALSRHVELWLAEHPMAQIDAVEWLASHAEACAFFRLGLLIIGMTLAVTGILEILDQDGMPWP